ncbi:phage major capsid protein [Candidatus Pacearchaeota archaeon]|nr:phage major capsid protein [Candidatus Pacearchaeota archaeon]
MAEVTPEEIEETGRLVKEVREAAEKSDAESKVKEEKLNTRLNELEEKNQELVTKQLESEKKEAEAKEAMDLLEKKLLRLPAGGEEKATAENELKVFERFLVEGGKGNMSAEEVKYLRTDSNVDGGVLAPNEYVGEIIKDITEISPIRSIARIRRTTSKAIEVPIRTSVASGGWTGEGETKTDSNSQYGMLEIPVNKLTAFTILTLEMLQDSAFNMETEVNQDITETFGQLEGTAFVLGDAVKKPQGFMAASGIQVVNSGVADEITADGLIEISGELKDGYNGIYVMNRRTLATTRTLKDGSGAYVWQNGIAAGLPSTINGDRYVSAIDMADVAANSLSVAYGDFSRGYTIVDHTQMTFVRDGFTLADQGKIRIIAHRRVGGQVTQKEAIKHLKTAV